MRYAEKRKCRNPFVLREKKKRGQDLQDGRDRLCKQAAALHFRHLAEVAALQLRPYLTKTA
ncbi:hypothetical protein H8Z60_26185 [Mycolicibacterium fortuitum]|nr:hypothetical protein [Mycolicibacterium fortuitum]